jgi:sulfonate transport system substrate-binding protein
MLKIRMGGVPEHFNLPIILANEFDLFKNKNIELEWHYFPAGTGAMTKAIAYNEIDIAVGLTEGVVAAIINGLEAKIIKQYISTPLIWGIHTGIHSNLKTIGECEGKKYAISRLGSGSHLMALIDAEIRGKSIQDNDFLLIENMDGALTSLSKNDSQVFFWEKYTTKPCVDDGQLKRIGEFITPWSCFQMIASNDLIKNHSPEIKELNQVINFSAKQFMKAPNSIEEVHHRFNLKLEDSYDWFYSTEWTTDQNVSEKMLENVMYSLKKINTIKSEVNPELLVASKIAQLI